MIDEAYIARVEQMDSAPLGRYWTRLAPNTLAHPTTGAGVLVQDFSVSRLRGLLRSKPAVEQTLQRRRNC